MPDNLESNSPNGSTEPPASPTSAGQNVQQPSSLSEEELLKRLEPLIDKKVQSVKDRRIAELEKQVSGFQSVLERFKGLVPDDKLREIQKDLEFEDLKQKVYGTEKQTSEPVAGSQQMSAADLASSIIAKAQLDANVPEVIELIRTAGNDPVEFAIKAGELKARMANKPAPTAANAPVLQTSTGSGEAWNFEAKNARFRELQKFPSKHKDEIKKLKQELEEHNWK